MDPGKDSERGETLDSSRLSRYDYFSPATWCDPNLRRIIMAALVRAVYKMEDERTADLQPSKGSGKSSTAPTWYETFHFDLVDRLVDSNGSIFGAVYQSRLNHTSYTGAPGRVVAFRGTMFKNRFDLLADLKISLHQLRSRDVFKDALQSVRKDVACHGVHSVCLAGHSLGASLALLVGRDLANERSALETHLFNPPFATLPIPGNLACKAHLMHNVVANSLSHVLQDKEKRKRDRDAFNGIRDWFPHLYINTCDPVCSAYLGYFEANDLLPSLSRKFFGFAVSPNQHSIRGMISSLVTSTDARPDHLIPSAILHINQLTQNNLDAHKLRQWCSLDVQLSTWTTTFDPQNTLHE